MHPLVHMWARDWFSEELQRCSWVTSSIILAAAISIKHSLTGYRFRRSLLPHIKSSISLCEDRSFLSGYSKMNGVSTAANFAMAFAESGLLQQATELVEKVLEAELRTMGSEHPYSLTTMDSLAKCYSDLGRKQEATNLKEKVLEARQRTLGSELPDTLRLMNLLADMERRAAVLLLSYMTQAAVRGSTLQHQIVLTPKHNINKASSK